MKRKNESLEEVVAKQAEELKKHQEKVDHLMEMFSKQQPQP